MKSTSSALTPRKIAEFCKSRFTTIFTESEVRLLYGCLVDLLERAEYPPYRGSGLDLQSLSAMLDINVERLRASGALAADLRCSGTGSFECGLATDSHGEPLNAFQGHRAFRELC